MYREPRQRLTYTNVDISLLEMWDENQARLLSLEMGTVSILSIHDLGRLTHARFFKPCTHRHIFPCL
jgi:hypothetical protein